MPACQVDVNPAPAKRAETARHMRNILVVFKVSNSHTALTASNELEGIHAKDQ